MATDPAVQALLDATDLPALIEAEMARVGRAWTSQRRGDHARGCCPFRDDAGAGRFRIRGGNFQCFGDTDPRCAQRGDAITFLRHLHGWTYRQALERLAEFTGIALPKSRGPVDPKAVRLSLMRAVARGIVPSEAPKTWAASARRGWDRAVTHRVAGRLPTPIALRDILIDAGATNEHLTVLGFAAHAEQMLAEPLVLTDPTRGVRLLPDGPIFGAEGPTGRGWASVRGEREDAAFAYTTDVEAWLNWLGQDHAGAVSLDPEHWEQWGRLPHDLHRASHGRPDPIRDTHPIVLVPATGVGRRHAATLGRWLLANAPRLRVLDLAIHGVETEPATLPTYFEWMVERWQVARANGREVTEERIDREMGQALHQVAGSREAVVYAHWWSQIRPMLVAAAPAVAPNRPLPESGGVSSSKRRAP